MGDVTDVTLVTLLTVASCTDKDKLCTVDLAGPIDQIKWTTFRYHIINKVGPVAILPGSSLAEEFWDFSSSWLIQAINSIETYMLNLLKATGYVMHRQV